MMKTPIRTLLLLAAPFFISACNESLVASRSAGTVPVSFRMLRAAGDTIPVTDLVQVRAWAGDSAHRNRFDSSVHEWKDKGVSLEVPLGQPLEFKVDGLNRRNNRLVSFWNATGRDTLISGDRSRSVVTLSLKTSSDTAGPSLGLLSLPELATLENGAGDTMMLVLPTGTGSGTLGISTKAIASFLVGGKAVALTDSTWSRTVARGDTLTLEMIGANNASTLIFVRVVSGDHTGPAFSFAVDNGSTESVKNDTAVFTLPYVIDSSITLAIRNADSKDRIASLSIDGKLVTETDSLWQKSIKIPVAGDSAGLVTTIKATDSLGNTSSKVVKIWRPFYPASPTLTWIVPPSGRLWGAQQDTLRLQITSGDSAIVPSFTLKGFTIETPTPEKVRRAADTSLWRCIVTLQERDSGTVAVTASNLSGKSASLDTVRISRYDPLRGLPPVFTVTAPISGQWFSTSIVMISGVGWSGTGKSASIILSDDAGWKDTAQTLDSAWSYSMAWTVDGQRIVTVKAVDASGQFATTTTTLVLNRDTRAPNLAWSGMSLKGDTLFTSADSAPLQAVFKDTLNGKVLSLAVVRSSHTDTNFAKPIGTDNLWRDTLDVRGLQGLSDWVAVSTDSAGNRNVQPFRILRDTAAPKLTITSPKAVSAFAGTSTTISATASDDVALDSVTIDATLVESPYAKTVLIPAAGTSASVVVRAKDRLGNLAIDSVVLTGIVKAPVQTSGVAPGATGREFFFDATCPDAGATLQDSATGWSTWSGRTFVASTVSKSLRCQANGQSSSTARFAWTPKDSSFALPSPILTGMIPDSAYAMASDPSGTLWLVSSFDSAWYWPKGDSTWRNTRSLLSSKGNVTVVTGATPDKRTWFLASKGTALSIVGTIDSTVTGKGSVAALGFAAVGKVAAHVGRSSIGLTYNNSGTAMVEIGNVLDLTIRSRYAIAGTSSLTSVAGITARGSDVYSALGCAHDTVWSYSVQYGWVQSSSSGPSVASRLLTGREAHAIQVLSDSSMAVSTSYFTSGPGGTATYGTIYRIPKGGSLYGTKDSAKTGGAAVHIAEVPTGNILWIGQKSTTSQAVAAITTSNWSISSSLPARTTNSTGARKLATTLSGSAWYLMTADGNPFAMHRYYPR